MAFQSRSELEQHILHQHLTETTKEELQTKQESEDVAPANLEIFGPDIAEYNKELEEQRMEIQFARSELEHHTRKRQKRRKKPQPVHDWTGKRWICDICGGDYATKQSRDMHIQVIHLQEKPFKCSHCPRAFGYKNNLKAHVSRIHLKMTPFKCKLCGKEFGGKRDLTRHLKCVHAKERPYKCSQCGKGFGQRSTMQTHMRYVHQKIRSICAICNLYFADLKKHIKAVHQKKIEKCDLCGNTYADLRRHKKRVHGRVIQRCNICGNSYADLRRHQKRVHPTRMCRRGEPWDPRRAAGFVQRRRTTAEVQRGLSPQPANRSDAKLEEILALQDIPPPPLIEFREEDALPEVSPPDGRYQEVILSNGDCDDDDFFRRQHW